LEALTTFIPFYGDYKIIHPLIGDYKTYSLLDTSLLRRLQKSFPSLEGRG